MKQNILNFFVLHNIFEIRKKYMNKEILCVTIYKNILYIQGFNLLYLFRGICQKSQWFSAKGTRKKSSKVFHKETCFYDYIINYMHIRCVVEKFGKTNSVCSQDVVQTFATAFCKQKTVQQDTCCIQKCPQLLQESSRECKVQQHTSSSSQYRKQTTLILWVLEKL